MITGDYSPVTSKWLFRSLLAAILSTIGCLSGLTPSISLKSPSIFVLNSSASAQNLTPEELTNYARSVLDIEPLRQQYYNEIKQQIAPGESVPEIICNKPDSLNELPGEMSDTAVKYCEQSIEIVESNNLTIQQFNDITNSLIDNPEMVNRITQELLRLQMQ